MASRATTVEEPVTADAVAEATADAPGKLVHQMTDDEIMAAIQKDMASRPQAPAPQRTSITDLYQQMVALVSSALGYREVKLRNETNATKILELALMWALNNRGTQPSHDILPTEEEGEADEAGDDGPAFDPDEVIGAAADQTGDED